MDSSGAEAENIVLNLYLRCARAWGYQLRQKLVDGGGEKEATAGARGCGTSSERRLTNRFRGASSISAFNEKIQADPLSLGDKRPAHYGYVLEVLPAGPRLLE